jgi:hypothetical protein
VINLICETPGADLDLKAVVQVGDLVLQAIDDDDLIELERLLEMAKEKNLTRVHGNKGLKYLKRRKMELRLKAAIEANGPVEELSAALEGATEANVPPSVVKSAEELLAKLKAIAEMRLADLAVDWARLEKAIHDARAVNVDEATIAPFLQNMLKLRASTKLRACLAAGEDGYPNLQAAYDNAVQAKLDSDEGIKDVAEAKRLLEALAKAQQFMHGKVDKWMGGGYEEAALVDVTDEATSSDSMLPKWLDNCQFKLSIGASADALKMIVSIDKSADASFEEYAVHVVKMKGKTGPEATQVGEDYEVIVNTAYLKDSDHEGSTAKLTFSGEGGSTYFVVVSAKEAKQEGDFTITTIGVGDYTLEPVQLLQVELQAAMDANAFEKLPAIVEQAESSAVSLANHALVIRAKLISEIERGWQEKDSQIMGTAIGNAKRAKVDKAVLKTYAMRYKQLAMEKKLQKGLDGDLPLLHAACEEAKLIGYDGNLHKESEAALKKYHGRQAIASLFLDDQAAGARKFGSWRENPQWKLTIKGGKKATLFVALNEDGALDDEASAKLKAKEAKKEIKYEKARDKMVASQAAAEEDEKNDELAAAAKDAARVFKELDDAKKRKQQREEDGEEDAFTSLGLHVVQNTRVGSWIPGVLSGFVDLVASEYGDDQAYGMVEIEASKEGDGEIFIVPSTFNPGEEGIFTLSVMSTAEFSLEEVQEFEGNMLKLKGEWSSSNQGPRGKKNGGKEDDDKKFKPEKTWNKNPQFRLWLRDPDTEEKVTGPVGLAISLSTPIEGAEMGMHMMRNTFCQFYNEKVEVLADRYQKCAGRTPKHEAANEIAFDITIDETFEVKKNGCEDGFPFFLVPSLLDKKMAGPFQMTVYSDKAIVIQMLDDSARKL